MESKKPWQSKTIVINAVLGGLSLAALFWPGAAPASEWIHSNGAVIGSVWAGLSIVLRMISKDAIQLGE